MSLLLESSWHRILEVFRSQISSARGQSTWEHKRSKFSRNPHPAEENETHIITSAYRRDSKPRFYFGKPTARTAQPASFYTWPRTWLTGLIQPLGKCKGSSVVPHLPPVLCHNFTFFLSFLNSLLSFFPYTSILPLPLLCRLPPLERITIPRRHEEKLNLNITHTCQKWGSGCAWSLYVV